MDKTTNCDKYFNLCVSCKYFCSHSGCNGHSCKDCDNGPDCKCLEEVSDTEGCPYYEEEK